MINELTAPIIDTVRIAKFMVSPRGLLFNIKQVGLQLTNPKKQFFQLPFINADRVYNPLALALQVPLNALGIHGDRHFLGQLNPRDIMYERVIDRIDTSKEVSLVSRPAAAAPAVGLMKLHLQQQEELVNKALIK